MLSDVARLHHPSQADSFAISSDEDPNYPTKELESQYSSNKVMINEIEGLLLSLVMVDNDDTLKLQYESEQIKYLSGIAEEQKIQPMIIT